MEAARRAAGPTNSSELPPDRFLGGRPVCMCIYIYLEGRGCTYFRPWGWKGQNAAAQVKKRPCIPKTPLGSYHRSTLCTQVYASAAESQHIPTPGAPPLQIKLQFCKYMLKGLQAQSQDIPRVPKPETSPSARAEVWMKPWGDHASGLRGSASLLGYLGCICTTGPKDVHTHATTIVYISI